MVWLMNYYEKYNVYLSFIEKRLNDNLNCLKCNEKLANAMKYSVLAGGKRVRPVLFLATLDILGVDYSKYGDFACAIECLHTYSLIHDDLPAMDNDDFRRGKPSNHKVFGEGFAVLAGDALLNYAFELCLNQVKNENDFLAFKLFADFAGVNGMINGQAYDLQGEELNTTSSLLDVIDENKTGKLLTAPLLMASLIAGGNYYKQLQKFGYLQGKMFQYVDDLLDVVGSFKDMGKTLGKDAKSNKYTAISVYGIEKTKQIINQLYDESINILTKIDNSEFLVDFVNQMKERVN